MGVGLFKNYLVGGGCLVNGMGGEIKKKSSNNKMTTYISFVKIKQNTLWLSRCLMHFFNFFMNPLKFNHKTIKHVHCR